MIKFHEVIEPMRRVDGTATLPTRATKGSGAYDFYAKTNYVVKMGLQQTEHLESHG